MKNLTLFSLMCFLTFGFTSSAMAGPQLQLRCEQISPKFGTQPLSFTLVGDETREGDIQSHQFELFSGKKKIMSLATITESEDVMIFFKSADGGIQGTIYMDELDQTSLTIGRMESRFDCNRDF